MTYKPKKEFTNEYEQFLHDHERYVQKRDDALKYAASRHIVLLSKREASCGHCPFSLLCIQHKPLIPLLGHRYTFAVCSICHCVHFTSLDETQPLYICGNIREGLYLSFPSMNGFPAAHQLKREEMVQQTLRYSRDDDMEVRQPMCGCCEATMDDIFPGWDGYKQNGHYGQRPFFTPLDPPTGFRMPPHLSEELSGFDCTTRRIYKRDIKIEEC